MYILEGTVLIQSSFYFVRMIILLKSRSNLKLGHVALKTSFLVEMIDKPFVHSRRHRFDPKFVYLCQVVCLYDI